MKKCWGRMTGILLCLGLLLPCLGAGAQPGLPDARRIAVTPSGEGYTDFSFLVDGDVDQYEKAPDGATITLEGAEGMASLYLLFDWECGEYSVTNNADGKSLTAGKEGYLHEYIDLASAFGTKPTSVTIRIDKGNVQLREIYAFSEGKLPDFVQVWQPPLEDNADILLLSTHGDDDQLYFAGLLPYYAGERQCRVQVAYLTDHRENTYQRVHEMLNGLWAVGVKTYPVFGRFADFKRDSLSVTYAEYEKRGTSKEELLGFVVEQLRRFNPQVVVGHDFNGEYGHGMHRLYADLLAQAVEIADDPTSYPELADRYGVWDVPKTYIHLYSTNPVVMDYDTPLAAFDGLTAFQVTQKYGFPCHETQQYDEYVEWIYGKNGEITKASQIELYNPCEFGLYRSTVGEDVQKNDLLENVKTYAEQEQEAAEREETKPTEQETVATTEGEPSPSVTDRTEETSDRMPPVLPIVGGGILLLVLVFFLVFRFRRRR